MAGKRLQWPSDRQDPDRGSCARSRMTWGQDGLAGPCTTPRRWCGQRWRTLQSGAKSDQFFGELADALPVVARAALFFSAQTINLNPTDFALIFNKTAYLGFYLPNPILIHSRIMRLLTVE